jgi:hypothetical protein
MMVLTETAADVVALIPRHAWLLMDEEQRDALMADVVLPRYMETTTDGIQLGPTWWAEAVGATAEAIRKRVDRLRQSQTEDADERTARLTEQRGQRATRQVLREADSHTVERIVEDLPPERRAQLAARFLADPDTRSAMVDEPEGIAAVEAIHQATTHKQPVRSGEPLPPPPAFASKFWRAVTAVQDANAELERFGVRGVDARPETRVAAERMVTQAADIRDAVADYVVEHIATEET